MTGPTTADSPPGAQRRRIGPGGIAVVMLVVASVAFWIWIFVFAPRGNPDRLDDRAFPAAAEPICASVQAEIDALPTPRETPLPAERAAQVAIGTERTEALVADLRAEAAGVDPDERAVLDSWFADWDAYVADRQAYVIRLERAAPDATGRELAFTLTERAEGGIYTRRIDGFANVNDMPSCHVPGDV